MLKLEVSPLKQELLQNTIELKECVIGTDWLGASLLSDKRVFQLDRVCLIWAEMLEKVDAEYGNEKTKQTVIQMCEAMYLLFAQYYSEQCKQEEIDPLPFLKTIEETFSKYRGKYRFVIEEEEGEVD